MAPSVYKARRFFPLRASRCLESRFDIGVAFGPVDFMQCIVRCEQHRSEHAQDRPEASEHRACGAVAYREVGGRAGGPRDAPQPPPPPPSSKQPLGMCQLKATKCTLRPSVQGPCHRPFARRDARKRGWCVFQLRRLALGPYFHPPYDRTCAQRNCTSVGVTTVRLPSELTRAAWTTPTAWPERWVDPVRNTSLRGQLGLAAAARGRRHAPLYVEAVGKGQMAVLGGGLNNMLMELAQLLTDTCDAGATLLLPPLDADPLRDQGVHEAVLRTCTRITYAEGRAPSCEWRHRPRPALVPFAEIFDLGYFRRRLWRVCGRRQFVAEAAPPGAAVVLHTLTPLAAHWWNMTRRAPPATS